jgi:two-component system sensor histidine kinase AlgZ
MSPTMTATDELGGEPVVGTVRGPCDLLGAEREPIEPLIPHWAVWFYVLSPPMLALLLHPEMVEQAPATIARRLSASWVHTVAIGASLHALYAWVVPRVIKNVQRRGLRLLIHFAFILLGTALGLAFSAPIAYLLSQWVPELPWWELYTSLVIASCWVLAMVSYQRMRSHAREVERRAQLAQQAALRARLASLMARTNPHFLFNSLNTVAGLIGEDPERAEEAVERLADLFRYTLDASRRARVTLHKEIEAVESYLAMEALRYEERLVYRLDVDDELASQPIPPLVVQPLVENAIRHGVEGRRSGMVEVTAKQQGDRLVIAVSDDGPGPGRSERTGSGTSLADLRQRLELLFGSDASLAVNARDGGGCTVELSLPAGGS